MWWTEIRGVLVVAAVIAGIALAWTAIEARPIGDVDVSATTTTSTTTTILLTTTTLSPDEANFAICDRARSFSEEASLVALNGGSGAVAELALDFWRLVHDLSGGAIKAELFAVISYYEDYIETGDPFDYDFERIIVEGDKEKLERLLTRPATGLAESRALVSLCGVTVPDQPTMGASDFEKLEDSLLDDDDKGDR